MTSTHDPTVLPTDIPVPQDDGAARHLADLKLPPYRFRRPMGQTSTCQPSKA